MHSNGIQLLCLWMTVLWRTNGASIIPDYYISKRLSVDDILLAETPEESASEEFLWQPNADEVGAHHEGDIVLPGGFERQVRAVTNADYRKWTKGVVPYTIDPYYSFEQKQMIYSAMDEIRKKTCISFVERTSEADYVRIMPGEGCSSYVGRRGGQQVVTLDPWRCLTEMGVVAHELLHVLGFYHEHTRLDRDSFITILWSNMEPGREVNFHKRAVGSIDDLGKQYDYNSVMHYSAYAFSRDERRPTLTPTSTNINLKMLGQRRELSGVDAEKINTYYGCGSVEEEPGGRQRTLPASTTTAEPPPPTRPTITLKQAGVASLLNPCDEFFDTNAIMTTNDGHVYIFSAEHFWVVDPHRYISKVLSIKQYYPNLPNDIDAAFTWINGHTYFFKGQLYWKYKGFEALDGYPQDIASGFPGLPETGDLDAAFVWTEGRIVFIKGEEYWVLHPLSDFNQVRGPLPLRKEMGFPGRLQAALEWPTVADSSTHSEVYLLADGLIYPLEKNVFKIASDKRPRRLMDWLRCDLYDRSASQQYSDANEFW
ncbi:uncharacterized protein LOC129589148 isoform X2 [Paramacrobiotus metropolitanus]|uniref:uncharacterized protein LOC129589148 isoform X2 n=1 Tax=Paramacrobiotus metropolitanus TaxID=2943436 RepID=UPI0024463E0E|nr:uncharacterized protein LOC129589148 isoform X2 [Paramacrobiotus metropolitanus]